MKNIGLLSKGILLMGLISLSSCLEDRLGEINTDPNNPVKVNSSLLLTTVTRNIVFNQFDYGDGAGLARHIARINYNETEQYSFSSKTGSWSLYYTQLNNVNDLIRISKVEGKPSTEAVGYIFKAFIGAQLTNTWRDVPFFQAAQSSKYLNPSYDNQKDIYTAEEGVISLLSLADKMLEENADPLPSDLMFGGDRLKWRKLANSLRLRYLMRISCKQNDYPQWSQQLKDVVSKPLMESNDDNATLPYLTSTPDRSPIFNMRSGEFDYLRMSHELDSILNVYKDPRMSVWFSPTTSSETTTDKQYKGVFVGCSSTTLTNIGYDATNVSQLGGYFRNKADGHKAILMNVSEVKFLLAEAAAKGYIGGDVKRFYEDGIETSISYYTSFDPSYIENDGVRFESSNSLEQIFIQKWLSLFFVGQEAWYDYLRTGYPRFSALLDNRNPSKPGEVPSRFYYPEDEQTLNQTNYKSAIERQGGSDDINSPHWWEKNN